MIVLEVIGVVFLTVLGILGAVFMLHFARIGLYETNEDGGEDQNQ
jgi:hypothetical protein